MSKILNKKLYFEGMRSLRAIGIITTVLLSIASIYSVLQQAFNYSGYDSSGVLADRCYVDLWDINPLIVLMFCAITPIMTVMIFNFCNSRAASDFYFSIPMRRGQLFGSFYAAVMSWTLIAIAVPSLITFAVGFFVRSIMVINVLSSLMFLLQVFVACFMVSAAVMIAVGLTGNPFSTIFTALIIIFLPRIAIMATTSMALVDLPIMRSEYSFSLLSSTYNIPFSFVTNAFGMGFSTMFTRWEPVIYTAVVGAIYLAVAFVLFYRRKSEAASYAAATTKLRAVFRIIIGAAILMVSSTFIFSFVFVGDWDYIILAALFTVLAFIGYCCYELITTKNARTMIKSMPGFLISVAANLVIIAIMVGLRTVSLGFAPTVHEIEGVYVYQQESDSYWSEKSSKVMIEDTEAKRIISNALDANIGDIKSFEFGKNHNFDNFYNKYSSENYTPWIVDIKAGGIKHNRMIYVENEESQKLFEILENNKEYSGVYTDLPDSDSKNTTVTLSVEGFDNIITAKDKAEIYKCYKNDVEKGNISFEKHYSIVTEGSNDSFATLYVATSQGRSNYNVWLPLTRDYPTAYAKFFEVIAVENAKNKKLIENYMVNFEEGETDSLYFEMTGNNDYYCTPNQYKKLAEILKSDSANIGEEAAVMRVNFEFEKELDDGTVWEYKSAFYPLTKAQVDALNEIGGEYQ